jgi:PncC family amidohydrolase
MNGPAYHILETTNKLLTAAGLTVSVAESCTGGLLSHYLTLLPGSSAFFRAGVVAYSTAAKETLLGIPRRAIGRYGVVSHEIAVAMAERIRDLSGSDFSLATTGNLGPAVLESKELGLVYIAVSGSFGSEFRELRLKGNREEIKTAVSIHALELLLEVIKKK